jgi:hypothetical protein
MPLTPEQFAWLMSLPADHPERVAWSGRPEFESMRLLYDQFEGARGSSVSDGALREAEVVLERRFRDAPQSESRLDPAGARPARQGKTPRPWWDVIPRPAFAMAAAMIVVVAGVWLAARPRSTALRGAQDAPVILEPRHVAEGLEIRWTPVAGAGSYRLSFVDDSMREIVAVEDWPGTSYRLKTSALPPGLGHGASVIFQVQPVRGAAPEGAVGTRSIRVP